MTHLFEILLLAMLAKQNVPAEFLATLAKDWRGGWACGTGWRLLDFRSFPSAIHPWTDSISRVGGPPA